MKRLLVLNWKWERVKINSFNELIKLSDNDFIILTKYSDSVKFNTYLSNLLNSYNEESTECLVMSHYRNNSNSVIKISANQIKKPSNFKGFFVFREFGGGTCKIYHGTTNPDGLLEDEAKKTPKETIKNENFEKVWNYYKNELELEFQKRKIINIFLPLILDIKGFNETTDKKIKDQYLIEIQEAVDDYGGDLISSELNETLDILTKKYQIEDSCLTEKNSPKFKFSYDSKECLKELFTVSKTEERKNIIKWFDDLINKINIKIEQTSLNS